MYDLIIIGGGAAGLGAALYAARFRLNVMVIAREFGGTGNEAHRVDNWIGDPGISGIDLMEKFLSHVKQYDVPLIGSTVTEIKKSESIFTVLTESGESYEAVNILFSNGMIHRKLQVPGEIEYAGKGVHYCYTCDGPLYRGKTLAVIGGSDSAALGSLFLSEYAQKVYTVIRRDGMTAEPISAEKVSKNSNIELVPNSNVVEIVGDGNHVTSVKLDTGKTIELDGIFVEIGHVPQNDLAKKLGVEVDGRGHIKVNRKQETNVAGVLAAGDITDATELKQFITSVAEGSIAAHTVYHSKQ